MIDHLNKFLRHDVIIGKNLENECLSHDSHAFIQVACVAQDTTLRKQQALIMACSVTFVALFVVNYIDYIQRLQEQLTMVINSGDVGILKDAVKEAEEANILALTVFSKPQDEP